MVIKEVDNKNFRLDEVWCQEILFNIEFYSSKLNASIECKNRARRLVSKLRNYSVRFSGKSYKAIAGALLYISGRTTKDLLTQREIYKTLSIAEPTLRVRIKEVHKIIY